MINENTLKNITNVVNNIIFVEHDRDPLDGDEVDQIKNRLNLFYGNE